MAEQPAMGEVTVGCQGCGRDFTYLRPTGSGGRPRKWCPPCRPPGRRGRPAPVGVSAELAPGTSAEQAVGVSVAAARDAGVLDDLDAGLAAVASAGARGVDLALASGQLGSLAHLLRQTTDTLTELRLTPTSRAAGGSDPWDELLAGLGTPVDHAQ